MLFGEYGTDEPAHRRTVREDAHDVSPPPDLLVQTLLGIVGPHLLPVSAGEAGERSLHSRTCLQARSVLALLSNGLVDPAWGQWRVCHESSTIATFIANNPEMAFTRSRYMRYSFVNKYHLAKELYDAGHGEAPSNTELEDLRELADSVQKDFQSTYKRKGGSRNYAWSGLSSFRDIEAAAFQGWEWNPRGEYILASGQIHSEPNAVEPLDVGDNPPVFLVGPTDSGLTGPADVTSMSIVRATLALMLNASCSAEDAEKLEELVVKSRIVGAMCWLLDPEIICYNCGGYIPGAFPPDLIPIDARPEACSCHSAN